MPICYNWLSEVVILMVLCNYRMAFSKLLMALWKKCWHRWPVCPVGEILEMDLLANSRNDAYLKSSIA